VERLVKSDVSSFFGRVEVDGFDALVDVEAGGGVPGVKVERPQRSEDERP
jgi:hypothetical protein